MSTNKLPLILLVDDEPANLVLMERVLGSDYRIFSVASGQAAIDALTQAPFDLVLLDIMMSGMNGLQTLTQIRTQLEMADLPVILVSALADAHSITEGLWIGANDYITKPIDVEVTRARVRTQLRLKQLEDKRKHTISELEDAHQLKDRFLRIASHDLKGPIHNIRMVASLMQRSSAGIPDGTALLEALETSTTTMTTVIEDFIDTAALQTGNLNLKLEEITLDPIVKSLLVQYTAHAARKNITLQIDQITGCVRADMARFQQALGNLVSNAIKYSPVNTTVKLWMEDFGAIRRICVTDQGPGIPVQEQERLFTQFGKLTPRPTDGESSTGLGLWIVKHLITLQEGHVGVETSPGSGSTFWIEMPAA